MKEVKVFTKILILFLKISLVLSVEVAPLETKVHTFTFNLSKPQQQNVFNPSFFIFNLLSSNTINTTNHTLNVNISIGCNEKLFASNNFLVNSQQLDILIDPYNTESGNFINLNLSSSNQTLENLFWIPERNSSNNSDVTCPFVINGINLGNQTLNKTYSSDFASINYVIQVTNTGNSTILDYDLGMEQTDYCNNNGRGVNTSSSILFSSLDAYSSNYDLKGQKMICLCFEGYNGRFCQNQIIEYKTKAFSPSFEKEKSEEITFSVDQKDEKAVHFQEIDIENPYSFKNFFLSLKSDSESCNLETVALLKYHCNNPQCLTKYGTYFSMSGISGTNPNIGDQFVSSFKKDAMFSNVDEDAVYSNNVYTDVSYFSSYTLPMNHYSIWQSFTELEATNCGCWKDATNLTFYLTIINNSENITSCNYSVSLDNYYSCLEPTSTIYQFEDTLNFNRNLRNKFNFYETSRQDIFQNNPNDISIIDSTILNNPNFNISTQFPLISLACSDQGTCGSGGCSCNSQRTTLDCDSTPEAIQRLLNGFLFGIFFTGSGFGVVNAYLDVSTTNDHVSIMIDEADAGLADVLGFVDEFNVDLFAKGEESILGRGQTADPQTLKPLNVTVYASMGVPMNFSYSSDIWVYPSTNVTSDVPFYQYKTTLGETLKIDINSTDRLYFTIVFDGSFNMFTEAGILESDPENQISSYYTLVVEIEDELGTNINLVLLSIYGGVLFICVFCICCCSSIWHATMSKIVPEMYDMKRNLKKEIIPLDKIMKEAQKLKPEVMELSSLIPIIEYLDKIPHFDKFKLPKKPNLAGYFEKIKELGLKADLENIKIEGMSFNVTPMFLLQILTTEIPEPGTVRMDLKGKITIKDFLGHIVPILPDPIDKSISLTSINNILEHIELVLEDFEDLLQIFNQQLIPQLKKIFPNLQQLPGIEVPENISLSGLLELVMNELDLKLSSDLKNLFQSLSADISQVNVPKPTFGTPSIVPISANLESPIITTPNVGKIITNLEYDKILPLPLFLFLKGFIGTIIIFIGAIFELCIEIVVLLFNIFIIHDAFAKFGIPNISSLAELKAALFEAFQGLDIITSIIEFFEEFIQFFNIFDAFSNWNCGGVITMISPIVFFVGASMVWIVLQKDLLLWIGVKLKLKNKGRASVVSKKFYAGGSKFMLLFYSLQAVFFALSSATTSNTRESCSQVDFYTTTIGKIIVVFIYIFVYVMLFFIFAGAPDWEKYKSYGSFRTLLTIFFDGIVRFSNLTLGVWTNDNLRGYNIIGRAERYDPQGNYFPEHETIMTLMAHSRAVIWIPIPLCITIAKFSESLNVAHVFVLGTTEHVRMKRHFVVRLITWLLNAIHVPIILAVIFTASTSLITGLISTLIPVGFVKMLGEFNSMFKGLSNYYNQYRSVAPGGDDLPLNSI